MLSKYSTVKLCGVFCVFLVNAKSLLYQSCKDAFENIYENANHVFVYLCELCTCMVQRDNCSDTNHKIKFHFNLYFILHITHGIAAVTFNKFITVPILAADDQSVPFLAVMSA